MGTPYPGAITLWNHKPLPFSPWMKMKKHGAATIYFKVKVPHGNIFTRCKEELNTAVLPYIALMLFGNGPDIPVRNLKDKVYGHIIIANLNLCFWKMIGSLSHMVTHDLGWDTSPWRVIPIFTNPRRGYPDYLTEHLILYQLVEVSG